MVARNKMVLSGTLGDNDGEVWSCSIHYVPSVGGSIIDQTRLDTWANNAVGIWCAAITASVQLAAGLSIFGFLRQVTIYGYGATGGAVASGVALQSCEGKGTDLGAPQMSVCASLITPTLGASGRGRVYWPGMGVTVSPDLRYDGNGQFATEFAAAMSDAGEEEIGLPFNLPAVYSPTLDAITTVSSVRVGDVVDTQRRRRDALVESYATVLL